MKLEIESVEFKNFLTFGSRIQKVPFLKGLNLVTGIDIDRKRSNASGKCVASDTIIEIESTEKIKKILQKYK